MSPHRTSAVEIVYGDGWNREPLAKACQAAHVDLGLAVSVLAVHAAYADRLGQSWLSAETVAKSASLGPRTVERAHAVLAASGDLVPVGWRKRCRLRQVQPGASPATYGGSEHRAPPPSMAEDAPMSAPPTVAVVGDDFRLTTASPPPPVADKPEPEPLLLSVETSTEVVSRGDARDSAHIGGDHPQAEPHPHEPNARRALGRIAQERHLAEHGWTVGGLVSLAYDVGNGNPWDGFRAIDAATVDSFDGSRNMLAVFATRLGVPLALVRDRLGL